MYVFCICTIRYQRERWKLRYSNRTGTSLFCCIYLVAAQKAICPLAFSRENGGGYWTNGTSTVRLLFERMCWGNPPSMLGMVSISEAGVCGRIRPVSNGAAMVARVLTRQKRVGERHKIFFKRISYIIMIMHQVW